MAIGIIQIVLCIFFSRETRPAPLFFRMAYMSRVGGTLTVSALCSVIARYLDSLFFPPEYLIASLLYTV